MKHASNTMSFMSMLGIIAVISCTTPVHATNRNIEAVIRGYGDLTLFYQALLNSGVSNELSENESYTVFAPTDASFARISRQDYPCFYAQQCRAQIADFVRDHIIKEKYNETQLFHYGSIKSIGTKTLLVEQPYVGDYTINGRKILSRSDVAGNAIYRIHGVIANQEDLESFHTAVHLPLAEGATTTHKTTVEKVYRSSSSAPPSALISDDASQTTTVIETTTTEQ